MMLYKSPVAMAKVYEVNPDSITILLTSTGIIIFFFSVDTKGLIVREN